MQASKLNLADAAERLVHAARACETLSPLPPQAHQSIGFSMWPTFNSQGDVFLTAKPWAASRAVSPGEGVLARSPSDPRNLIVKRGAWHLTRPT